MRLELAGKQSGIRKTRKTSMRFGLVVHARGSAAGKRPNVIEMCDGCVIARKEHQKAEEKHWKVYARAMHRENRKYRMAREKCKGKNLVS